MSRKKTKTQTRRRSRKNRTGKILLGVVLDVAFWAAVVAMLAATRA